VRDWKDLGPRLAIAWAPKTESGAISKNVIRAGFGMFYDRFGIHQLRSRNINAPLPGGATPYGGLNAINLGESKRKDDPKRLVLSVKKHFEPSQLRPAGRKSKFPVVRRVDRVGERQRIAGKPAAGSTGQV
jgi:hypothetical protein